jgi:hypothetical protein
VSIVAHNKLQIRIKFYWLTKADNWVIVVQFVLRRELEVTNSILVIKNLGSVP